MRNGQPLVSVVIPTINEEKYLPRCLSSFSKQTFKDFETIISDGGSTDRTIEIARKFGAKIIVIPRSTVTIARQKGTDAAGGKIIVGADADTVYPSKHLEMIVSDYKKNNNVIAVGGGGVFEKKPWWMYWLWKITYFILGKLYRWFGLVIYIPGFNLSFRKEVFKKIGGYRTYLDFGGDELDIVNRLKKVGKIYFDEKLRPNPSSRRAKVGFLRLIAKHVFIYYFLNYWLAHLFKKPIIKGKPVR